MTIHARMEPAKAVSGDLDDGVDLEVERLLAEVRAFCRSAPPTTA